MRKWLKKIEDIGCSKKLKKVRTCCLSFDNTNWSFSDGIPESQKAAAIKFIVESINQGHPVIITFKNSTTEGRVFYYL